MHVGIFCKYQERENLERSGESGDKVIQTKNTIMNTFCEFITHHRYTQPKITNPLVRVLCRVTIHKIRLSLVLPSELLLTEDFQLLESLPQQVGSFGRTLPNQHLFLWIVLLPPLSIRTYTLLLCVVAFV